MKLRTILMYACCTVAMMTANNAFAMRCDLSNCATTINGDAGHASKRCTSTLATDGCACTNASQACDTLIISAGSTCTGGWGFTDTLLDGRKCCIKNCAKKSEVSAPAEEVKSEQDADLEDVFNAQMGNDRASEYYGYVDGVLRSPNNGRTTSASARLDACLFYTDVDNITGADNSEKWTNCYGSQGCGTTIKNEYCRATGTNNGTSMSSAVCKDRCDCVFGFGTCESL